MTTEEKLNVQKMRRMGKGYRIIAQELSIPISTVAKFCRNHEEDCLEICPQCGAKLMHTPKHKKKKFCSDKCRTLWWNSHLDQVNRQAYYKGICKYCRKEFISYGNKHRVFCSRKCADEYKQQNGKRARAQ